MVIRYVIKINSDEDIVSSLRTQNRHISEDVDWGKVSARVCYRRRARNDFECHPLLETPLVQCSRCPGYGDAKRICKNVSKRCAHYGGDHTGATCWA
ncbi:hypothetical protein EVAR_63821_1 [Eumeta japonica]|uniref:Uncharacterized protein n=1 Tax=Eumeta variegata TaxID=151549 RepID=A0A4C1ZKQ3_EUMVA|nr:hypothetical protein EVAR_63821_1 [Eumeta japonica]